jgi:diguanylate cyclase (GGDEF)-like protein
MVREEKLSSVLSEFARTMVTDFPIQKILDHLVERIVEVLPITAAGVTLIDPGAKPHFLAASNAEALLFEKLQTELDQGPCVMAYTSGEAVSVPNLRGDERFPQFSPAAVDGGLEAVFTFPLRHGDGRLGALDLYRDTPGTLDEDDMVAAQTLADVAAAYLINAQSREAERAAAEKFQDSSLHDALTGVPNRVLLKQRLDHASKRARRGHTSAAIVFVDLDRFKAVNDTYGHHIGDQLLVEVAARLSHLVRPGDTLARVSGDEFVFLCVEMKGVDNALVLADRISGAFAEPFVLDEATIAMTASVGVAFAGPGEEISAKLVADADVAMYQAKRAGGAGHRILDLRDMTQTDMSQTEVNERREPAGE